MATGDIFRADEVGGGGQEALIEVETTSGQIAYARAALEAGAGGGGAGDASAAKQDTQITAANLTNTNLGGVTETAPANDTASSGLNGRLQRIAQRITSLIALVPASLGQKAKSASFAVTLASDDDLLTKVGEVQASPTANTVLGRLKDLLSLIVLAAGENHIGQVGGTTTRPSASFAVPNSAATYAIGDLVANSATAGSVTVMTFAVGRIALAGGMLRRCRIRKTGTGVVGASFRLHLYSAAPTPSNGDDGAWLTSGAANYVGAMDVTIDKVFTDGAAGNGVPLVGSEINFTAATYYGLLEARGAYVRTAGETFDIVLEDIQN